MPNQGTLLVGNRFSDSTCQDHDLDLQNGDFHPSFPSTPPSLRVQVTNSKSHTQSHGGRVASHRLIGDAADGRGVGMPLCGRRLVAGLVVELCPSLVGFKAPHFLGGSPQENGRGGCICFLGGGGGGGGGEGYDRSTMIVFVSTVCV